MAAPLPFAAGLDWIEAILPFLFILFWIVSQIRNLFRGAEVAKPRGPAPARPAPRPVADDDAHRELVRQIEEFVRGSGGEQARDPQPPRRRAAPPAPRGRTVAPSAGRGSPPAPKPVPPMPKPVAVQPRAMGSLGGHAGDVSRHVHDAFAHKLEHLPAGLGHADAAVAPAATAGPAPDIAALLRSPATLRQLVIVREILDRPVDRW